MALHLDLDSLIERLYEPMYPIMKKRLAKELEELKPYEKEFARTIIKNLDKNSGLEDIKELRPYLPHLKKLLAQPLRMPNDKRIGSYTRSQARPLATAWIQLLVFDLKERPNITLDQSLMPYERETDPKLWQAWLETINSVQIRHQDARDSLKNFADQVLAPSLPAHLPLNIIIESFSPTEYKAKRKA